MKLSDYQPPRYFAKSVDLTFNLGMTATTVTNVTKYEQNELYNGNELILNGEDLELVSIEIDGAKPDYTVDAKLLTLKNLPKSFTLTVVTKINPAANKTLSGLYQSGEILCTQNEAEGFRRITYFQDRPDVMSLYTTTIIGDKKQFPFMLSNGNKIEERDLEDGKHLVKWQDPFKKPTYLFALVAGELDFIEDYFTTMSGRKIKLQIFSDPGESKKCLHAMKSLKQAMKWDEDTFGLEYDLDLFMVVAVNSFNAGAMENKGLNIFNSALTLADPMTATDTDYNRIQGVIGHEYFHNWTGDRVTCRDWFQLTLKEGLTVFRDQSFSQDMTSYLVKRLDDVDVLRRAQFPEDAGPMSHPIKPKEYLSIDNFYSSTVYEKGAEVIRMIETILGKDGFKKGITKYFELFDGQAVTTEDFLYAMSKANNDFNFDHFKLWYDQSGTPIVTASWEHDLKSGEFTLHLSQMTPPTADQAEKKALLLPIRYGLVNEAGVDVQEGVYLFEKDSEDIVFHNIFEKVVPSLNRDFSAPIKLNAAYTTKNLEFLIKHDTNMFNRAEACKQLATAVLKDILAHPNDPVDHDFIATFRTLLHDKALDDASKAVCLTLPGHNMILADQQVKDFAGVIAAFDKLNETIATELYSDLQDVYNDLRFDSVYDLSKEQVGKRSLRGVILRYLSYKRDNKIVEVLFDQFKKANNMTDKYSALTELCNFDSPMTENALKEFYNTYNKDILVVNKMLTAVASSRLPSTPKNILKYAELPQFDKTIPNMSRALYSAFFRNERFFHAVDGSGYKLCADMILDFDKFNPSLAAGVSHFFKDYQHLPSDLKSLMEVQLRRILAEPKLSTNTMEIISKTLG